MNSIGTLERPAAKPSTYVEDEPLFEIIDGQKVELPPMSAYANQLAGRLNLRLSAYADQRKSGMFFPESLFELPAPVDRDRRPDNAFLSYERWPANKKAPEEENAWAVVPNLAIEIVSPYDKVEELKVKIREYFLVGVELVWVIHPKTENVEVYQSPTSVRILGKEEVLDGGEVLPGFQLPLKELFLDG